ncbi:alpha/beta fold hydrolase [uncultured Aquimarina sp.]|uniref:alpha/beta hydrolase family protein n=1 Tax=uncultured Aquimarina sp. TaxID=575652 RepID=UPI00261AD079|nr:alpha/beta fold hydrolase [uncultured Aquimarina sp.]
MNRLFIIFSFFFFTIFSFSQDVSGDWIGEVNVNGNKLEIAFNVEKVANDYVSTLSILKQGLSGAKASATVFADSIITISFPDLKLEYKGRLNDKMEIIGNFSQSGHPIPLNLKKGTIILNRPQEPKPPFNYHSENVVFVNKDDNVKLSGTLTVPKEKSNYPLAIIVSGSGAQNRDGDMFGHKPYFVLANELTKNGIAVFRFDERGVGESEGDFNTVTIDVSAADVKYAIDFLKERKEFNNSKIGLIGHSIGGIVAPKVAVEKGDLDFLVLLAAPGINGDKLMLLQKAAFERNLGINELQIQQGQKVVKEAYDIVVNSDLDNISLKDSINSYYSNKYGALFPENQRKMLVEQITGSEVASFIRSQPAVYLEEIDIPVLALNGDKDLQVLVKENLTGIKDALAKGGNQDVEIVTLENLNHLFQESESGSLSEYAEIEQTFSPKALTLIIDWVKKKTK